MKKMRSAFVTRNASGDVVTRRLFRVVEVTPSGCVVHYDKAKWLQRPGKPQLPGKGVE